MEILKRAQLRNIFVIIGLTTGDQFSPEFLCTKLIELLKINIRLSDVNNTHKFAKQKIVP